MSDAPRTTISVDEVISFLFAGRHKNRHDLSLSLALQALILQRRELQELTERLNEKPSYTFDVASPRDNSERTS
jgi:hypothetical protein